MTDLICRVLLWHAYVKSVCDLCTSNNRAILFHSYILSFVLRYPFSGLLKNRLLGAKDLKKEHGKKLVI